MVLNWILQHEGLRFSQDSFHFTSVLAHPLVAVVDEVPEWLRRILISGQAGMRRRGRPHLTHLPAVVAAAAAVVWAAVVGAVVALVVAAVEGTAVVGVVGTAVVGVVGTAVVLLRWGLQLELQWRLQLLLLVLL